MSRPSPARAWPVRRRVRTCRSGWRPWAVPQLPGRVSLAFRIDTRTVTGHVGMLGVQRHSTVTHSSRVFPSPWTEATNVARISLPHRRRAERTLGVDVKVYVSSTFKDLQEHRTAVDLALRRMGHDVVGMEQYVAEGMTPLERSTDMVDRVLKQEEVSGVMEMFGKGDALQDTTLMAVPAMVKNAGTTRALVINLGQGTVWWST